LCVFGFLVLFILIFCFFQQLEKEIVADEKVQREQDKCEEENAKDDDVGDRPF